MNLPLKKMTRSEKLRAMEQLWSDLSRNEAQVKSPAWHADVLKETEAAIDKGEVEFIEWETAKKSLRRRAK